MTKFSGKVEVQDLTKNSTITLDGIKGKISAGGRKKIGEIVLQDIDGKERMSIGADVPISAQDASGKTVFGVFDKTVAGVLVGADKEEGGKKPGLIVMRDKIGHNCINLDGLNSLIEVRDGIDSESTISLDGNNGSIVARDIGIDGNLVVSYTNGKDMAKIGYRYGKSKSNRGNKKIATQKRDYA